MNKLRTIIADDEGPAREFLKTILRDFKDVELVGEAQNGEEALCLIRSEKPDLALLDLQMPEFTGLEVVRRLDKNEIPIVAFITAFDEYAIKAFEMNAIDYLLKPVESARLRETLNRVHEQLQLKDIRGIDRDKIRAASDVYENFKDEFIKRIPVKKRDEILLIPVDDVASIVANGELLNITTRRGESYLINFRLKDIEAKLNPNEFIRLSRGALANVDMFEKVAPMPGGTYLITLLNGQELSSSRQQSKILREVLLKL